MGETVSGRLSEDLVEGLDELGEATGRTRSEVLREVVQRGLIEARLERALDAYRRGEVSLGRASEMARVPITVLLDKLRAEGIQRSYDVEELERDLDWAEDA